jgi:hypothetical protein
MCRRLAPALLAVAAGCLSAPAGAVAAEDSSEAIEQRCVAAAMALPPRLQTVVYNRHPQSKTESRIEADVAGTARRQPRECAGLFSRRAFARVQFQSSTSGQRWIAVGKAWESLYLEEADSPPIREFRKFGRYGPMGLTIGAYKPHRNFGCVLRSRLLLRLELVEEGTGRVVAARFVELPGEIDEWRKVRCLGQLSIRDKTSPCGQSLLAIGGGTPHRWTISVKGVGCGAARRIAGPALQGGFPDASLAARRVRGWRCVYSQNSAAACMRGARRIYLRTREELGTDCRASRQETQLIAAGVPCSTASELSRAAAGDLAGQGPAVHQIMGRAWRCFAFAVAPFVAHHCYAGAAMVVFAAVDESLQGPFPTTIPADAIYPGNGASAIGRTPLLRIEDGFVRGGQVVLEVVAEESLSGQVAQLEVALWRWRCRELHDPDPLGDDVRCGRLGRVGAPVRNELTLQSGEQLVPIGPIGRLRREGDWSYDARITTDSFSAGGVLYAPAKVTLSYIMFG